MTTAFFSATSAIRSLFSAVGEETDLQILGAQADLTKYLPDEEHMPELRLLLTRGAWRISYGEYSQTNLRWYRLRLYLGDHAIFTLKPPYADTIGNCRSEIPWVVRVIAITDHP